MENERVWRPRMEIKRVWRPRMEIERVGRPRTESERAWRQAWRSRENGDFAGKANGTPPDFGLSRELWTGRGSATSRQWSGTSVSQAYRESAG